MKNPKFVIHTAADGKPYFTLQAANGQVLVTSETYEEKASVLNGISSVVVSVIDMLTDSEPISIAQALEAIDNGQIKVDDQTL